MIFISFFTVLSCSNQNPDDRITIEEGNEAELGLADASPSPTAGPSSSPATEASPSAASPSAIAVSTRMFEEDGAGNIVFSTNDPAKCGNAWWWSSKDKTYTSSMNTIESTVMKASGYDSAGFGIVFAPQKNAMLRNYEGFYRLIITVNASYCLGRIRNGAWETVIPWKDSIALVPGYGASNRIGVIRDPATNRFTISFNGVPADEFFDAQFPGALAGGFYAKVSANENERFPDVPTVISFNQTLPVSLP